MAWVFFLTTVGLAGALAWGWIFISRLALRPLPEPPLPAMMRATSGPASPLQIQYQLNMPGRGEMFPALAGARAADYWPLAVLSIANTATKPVLQIITAQVRGWSEELRLTAVIGPHEVRTFELDPELLAKAYDNSEIRPATLVVEVQDPATGHTFAQQRPVFLHSASDLYWGRKFANAQLLARWVTPHDDKVLQLVSRAERLVPGGRLRGYNPAPHVAVEDQVRAQARAVFEALRRSGISYVSSIYTFGNYPGETQRIRLPRETLELSNANCIDVSVVFASALENLGLKPVIVIVPGHAFTGVRLASNSQEILYLDLTVLPKGTFAAAVARAQLWLKRTPQSEVLTVDIGAARSLGVYPMPVAGARQTVTAAQLR
jgi:transglutaminase-like putative cysteine protease